MITHFQNDARGNKKGGPDQDHPKISAAKAAKPAQNLPDRAAIRVAICITNVGTSF